MFGLNVHTQGAVLLTSSSNTKIYEYKNIGVLVKCVGHIDEVFALSLDKFLKLLPASVCLKVGFAGM